MTSRPRTTCRLLLGLLTASACCAQTVDEYQIKAAFLYNFAKFVDWPPQTFKTDKEPITICVLGENPFGRALVDTVSGKSVLGRSFEIANISTLSQAADCRILFVASSERKHLRLVLVGLPANSTLTVGETDGFATQGGIINFKVEEGRVRLEINLEAAVQAKLRISSKVLNLAEIVKTGPQK